MRFLQVISSFLSLREQDCEGRKMDGADGLSSSQRIKNYRLERMLQDFDTEETSITPDNSRQHAFSKQRKVPFQQANPLWLSSSYPPNTIDFYNHPCDHVHRFKLYKV